MNNQLALTTILLRRWVGVLAIALPIVEIIINLISVGKIPSSISDTYYTSGISHTYFTGNLFVIAVFLFCYNGYDFIDKFCFTYTGGFLFTIAIIPDRYWLAVHDIISALAFISMAYISYFQFTKTGLTATNEKLKRNVIYRTCGIVIISALVCIPIQSLFKLHLIIYLEAIMLWAFGFSWLVKGETILKDK